MLAAWAQGSYKSLTFSVMPLPPSVSMQARGREGSLSPPPPLRGGHRGVESGEARRQLPWGLSPGASQLKSEGQELVRANGKETSSLHSPCLMER